MPQGVLLYDRLRLASGIDGNQHKHAAKYKIHEKRGKKEKLQ